MKPTICSTFNLFHNHVFCTQWNRGRANDEVKKEVTQAGILIFAESEFCSMSGDSHFLKNNVEEV